MRTSATSDGIDTGGRDGRLRVLVVTVSAGGVGGMQQHARDLVRGLVAVGHDVEVVCPSSIGLTQDLYEARWTLLPTAGRSREWPRLVVAAYGAATARGAIDIVHSESTSGLPLVHAQIPTPIAVKYHGNYLGLAKAHARRAFARPRSTLREVRRFASLTRRHFEDGNAWGLRRCVSMVPSRQQLRDTSRSHFISSDLLHVVPNGVDVSLFRPGDRTAARLALGIKDGVVLATVGRLNREKGFDVALEALARIATSHPEVRLLVVGDGEERASLEKLARRLGVAERADFVGAQPQDRVADYLVASDMFLFPTRREEAGPLVLPQALACGLPVIASQIGGVSEVLEPRTGDLPGILIRPGSVAELEAALRRLIEDPALRASLSTAARERVVSEYSLETMITRTVAVYRAAIARARMR